MHVISFSIRSDELLIINRNYGPSAIGAERPILAPMASRQYTHIPGVALRGQWPVIYPSCMRCVCSHACYVVNGVTQTCEVSSGILMMALTGAHRVGWEGSLAGGSKSRSYLHRCSVLCRALPICRSVALLLCRRFAS